MSSAKREGGKAKWTAGRVGPVEPNDGTSSAKLPQRSLYLLSVLPRRKVPMPVMYCRAGVREWCERASSHGQYPACLAGELVLRKKGMCGKSERTLMALEICTSYGRR